MGIINFIKTQSRMRKYMLAILFILFTTQTFLTWDATSSIGDNIAGHLFSALIFFVLAFLLTLNTAEDLGKNTENVESKTLIHKIIRFNRAVGGASVVLWFILLFPLVMIGEGGNNSGYTTLLQISAIFSPLIVAPSWYISKKFYSQFKLRESLVISFFCYWFLLSVVGLFIISK